MRATLVSTVCCLVLASGCGKKQPDAAPAKAAAESPAPGPSAPGTKSPAGPAPAGAGPAPAAVVRSGGRSVERLDDGTVDAKADGNRATIHPDGTVDAKAADGTQATIRSGKDGSAVVSEKGSVKSDAAGNTEIAGPGGRRVKVGADGSVQVGGVKISAD